MKYINGLFWICILLLSTVISAQELDDKTLLTIDGTQYDAGTFMKFYFKNIDIVQDEDQKDVDNYMDLYIDYRLKLQQAKSLGLDKKESYLKQIESTRSSLAQAYLTDNEVSDQLVREAYDRSLEEINASHILVKVPRSAAPKDTLEAWSRIHKIYEELQKGAVFGELARTKSEGPSAGNDGNLGWFGSFRMAYEFESGAYNTAKGEFSKPFRTDFGYHIVYVHDRRPNPGEVTVAHIMTFDKQNAEQKNAADRIQEIYAQLESGKNFEALAKEFSDDSNTAPIGGKLNRFNTSGVDATFAEAAFELQEKGTYSKPIQTRYGWHIIKLLKKHPLKTFDEVQKELQDKIQKSPRSRKITEAFTDKLKSNYGISEKMKLPKEVYAMVDDSLLMVAKFKAYPSSTSDGIELFHLNKTMFNATEFLNYVEQRQLKDARSYTSKKDRLDAFYESYVNEKIVAYYDAHLERDNEDFAFLFNEFKEGFLVFDLTESEIWNKAKTDSLGQEAYYKAHKNEYRWKRRLDIVMTQSVSEEVAQEVRKQLLNGVVADTIKSNLNIDNKTQVIVSSGTVEETYNRLPQGFEVKKGVSDIYHDQGDSFYKVIEVREITEPAPKTFEEAKSSVISDYQQELEKNWLGNLRTGHKIKVNQKVLKAVKSQIAKTIE